MSELTQSTAQNQEPVVLIHKIHIGGRCEGMLRKGVDADRVLNKPLYTSPQSTAEPSQWEVDFNEVLRERNEALAKIAEQRKVMEMALTFIRSARHHDPDFTYHTHTVEALEKALT